MNKIKSIIQNIVDLPWFKTPSANLIILVTFHIERGLCDLYEKMRNKNQDSESEKLLSFVSLQNNKVGDSSAKYLQSFLEVHGPTDKTSQLSSFSMDKAEDFLNFVTKLPLEVFLDLISTIEKESLSIHKAIHSSHNWRSYKDFSYFDFFLQKALEIESTYKEVDSTPESEVLELFWTKYLALYASIFKPKDLLISEIKKQLPEVSYACTKEVLLDGLLNCAKKVNIYGLTGEEFKDWGNLSATDHAILLLRQFGRSLNKENDPEAYNFIKTLEE